MSQSEPFLINPPRRRRRSRRRNPSTRPHRRRRRSRRNAPTTIIKGYKHRPVLYGPPRKRAKWSRTEWSKSRRRGISVNPPLAMVGNPRRRRRHTRRYRHNPVMNIGGIPNQFMRILPLAVTGIASGVVVNMVPGYLNLDNVWMRHGAKAAIALIGGPIVGRYAGSDHGLVWAVVGISSLVQDLVRQFMPGVIPGLNDAYPGYYDSTSISAFPDEVGAFPNEVSGGYPEEVGYSDMGYSDMGESPYPY